MSKERLQERERCTIYSGKYMYILIYQNYYFKTEAHTFNPLSHRIFWLKQHIQSSFDIVLIHLHKILSIKNKRYYRKEHEIFGLMHVHSNWTQHKQTRYRDKGHYDLFCRNWGHFDWVHFDQGYFDRIPCVTYINFIQFYQFIKFKVIL